MKPTVGRIVHYVLAPNDLPNARVGEVRPAVVVRVNPTGSLNLSVILDGTNDQKRDPLSTSLWCGSVDEGSVPGTWHWPERV